MALMGRAEHYEESELEVIGDFRPLIQRKEKKIHNSDTDRALIMSQIQKTDNHGLLYL